MTGRKRQHSFLEEAEALDPQLYERGFINATPNHTHSSNPKPLYHTRADINESGNASTHYQQRSEHPSRPLYPSVQTSTPSHDNNVLDQKSIETLQDWYERSQRPYHIRHNHSELDPNPSESHQQCHVHPQNLYENRQYSYEPNLNTSDYHPISDQSPVSALHGGPSGVLIPKIDQPETGHYSHRAIRDREALAGVNGVVIPSRVPFGARPYRPISHARHNFAFDFYCPVCGAGFGKKDHLKSHFPRCVAINGNPSGARWDDGTGIRRKAPSAPRPRRDPVELTEVNGVVIPAKRPPGATLYRRESRNRQDCALCGLCPICGTAFGKMLHLKNHFVVCVGVNGNPAGARWDDLREDDTQERGPDRSQFVDSREDWRGQGLRYAGRDREPASGYRTRFGHLGVNRSRSLSPWGCFE